MQHRRPFRHKRRRFHYHPAALGHPDAAADETPALSRRGVLWTSAALLVLSAPFALAFVMALLLGPDNTRRWLSAVNAEWLAPWLK
jgi:hypothetical protein